MGRLSDAEAFMNLSRAAKSPAELDALLRDISAEMGFDHFALMHHVDLTPFSQELDHMTSGQLIALSNYPESWIEHFVNSDLVVCDPIVLASHRTFVGFSWDRVPKLIRMTSQQKELLVAARAQGLEDGFTVPANIPGEATGSINFAVGPGKAMPTANLPMAQLIGSYAFEAARLLVRRDAGIEAKAIVLTQRQLECLIWAARGKTDWEIGTILGLSEDTVKMHIKDARDRYGVPKRVQAVIRAVFDGQLPLSELIR